jgi:hypothetical protein
MSDINDFVIVCDETNNNKKSIKNRELNISFYIPIDEVKYYASFDCINDKIENINIKLYIELVSIGMKK